MAIADAKLEILEEQVVLLFEREAWRYGVQPNCARAHATHHDVQRVEDIHIAIAREHERVAHELSN